MRLPVEILERAKARSVASREILARYGDCLLAQALLSIACNAIHSIEERAAKFMLTASERSDSDSLSLTQGELA